LTPALPRLRTVVVPSATEESCTLLVLNGIRRVTVTVRVRTTGTAAAGVLVSREGVAVAAALAAGIAVSAEGAIGCDPQAPSASSPPAASAPRTLRSLLVPLM
jgi:hypothetical protein